MPDAEDGKPPNAPVKELVPSRWARFVSNVKRKFHERKAKKEIETPTDRAARRTASATVWIAIFTVILALVGLITLAEVIGGGRDTRDLAIAAKQQADKMKDMSDAADKIRQAADKMVAQDQRIADNSGKSITKNAEQGRATLNATIEEYRLEHRAWVSMNGIQTIRTEADGTMHEIQVSQVHSSDKIAMNVHYRNTGSTPAFDVRTAARGVIFPTNPTFTDLPSESTPAIVQPSDGVFQTLDWGAVTQTTANEFNSSFVYVFGRIDYRDAFGVPHWSTFCRRLLNAGGQSQCLENLDTTDKNAEKNPN
jgi:hypothetical protein